MISDEAQLRVRIARADMSFSAAHFTIFSAGLRERLHGHDYHVCFEYAPPKTELGQVLDYRVAKNALRKLCLELNERTLIPRKSPFLVISEGVLDLECIFNGERFIFPRGDIYLMDVYNITLEALSEWFARRLRQILSGLHVDFFDLAVRVTSSGDQSAEFRIGGA